MEKSFPFDEIFEEVPIFCDCQKYNSTVFTSNIDPWLKPFDPEYEPDQEMAYFIVKKSDYAFSYYICEDGASSWGVVTSVHHPNPFNGLTLFDSKMIFKRNDLLDGREVFQVERSYCLIMNVFKVRDSSPVAFNNEAEFQFYLEQIKCPEYYLCMDFPKPDLSFPSCFIDHQN